MTPVEQLKAAKALIADEGHWTKEYYARNGKREHTNLGADDATCWCAYGALMQINPDIKSILGGPVCHAEVALMAAAGEQGKTIPAVNDHGTHADVMRLYDRAIEIAKVQS